MQLSDTAFVKMETQIIFNGPTKIKSIEGLHN